MTAAIPRLRAAVALAAACVAFGAAACLVPEVDLTGKACDLAHPCIEGFTCSGEGTCVPLDKVAPDSGFDGGSAQADAAARLDAGPGLADAASCEEGTHFCGAGGYYRCTGGVPALEAACAAGECVAEVGCPRICSTPGECGSGSDCDLATLRCVVSHVCDDSSDCPSQRCVGGACVPVGETNPTVVLPDGGGLPAMLDCYATGAQPDAGTGAVDAAFVTVRGSLMTAAGWTTADTIGLSVHLYRADDFNESGILTLLASTVARDVAELRPDAGLSGFGAFQFADPIQADLELVALAEGRGSADGGMVAVKTYQYVTAPSVRAVAGVVDLPLVVYDSTLWGNLVSSSGVSVSPGRAGIAGQLYDCRTPPMRVQGATVALSTSGRPFYGMAKYLALEPDAVSTPDTGRFFFFDVPIVPLTVIGGAGENYTSKRIRTLPDSVVVVPLKP